MYINLTPHPIVVRYADGEVTFPPSGVVARVLSNQVAIGSHEGIPIMAVSYTEPVGIPPPKADIRYIVSGMVRSALGDHRPDVVSPDTGAGAFRDSDGRIVAVRAFVGTRIVAV